MSNNQTRRLTAHERRTLQLAARKGGVPIVARRAHKTDRTITRATANRVALEGWATIINEVLLISRAGRAKLAEPLPPDAPVFLRRRDGLTTRRDQKVPGEPEVMTAPHPDWAQHAELMRRNARQDTNTTRLSGLTHPEERLRELRLLAAQAGVDVSSDLGVINRKLSDIERKLARRIAA